MVHSGHFFLILDQFNKKYKSTYIQPAMGQYQTVDFWIQKQSLNQLSHCPKVVCEHAD